MRISDWSSDVFSSDLRLFGLGEFIESVSENQAAIGGELAAFGAEVVDRLARRATPAPGAVDQFADAAFAFHAAHDRSGVADLDVLARSDIGSSLGHRDLDLEVVEILDNRSDVDLQAIVIEHRSWLSLWLDDVPDRKSTRLNSSH